MITQEERQNYVWRPNDNSATTKIRYELEAQKWYDSFRAAELKNKSSLSGDLSAIGLIVKLVVSIFLLVFFGIKSLIQLIRS